MLGANKNIPEFLQVICSQIRYKSVHKSIVNELSDHIEEQKQEYIRQGFCEETAEVKAIEQMGDPVIVGKQLDNTHRPKTEWSILSLAAVLVVIGGAVQFLLSRSGLRSSDMFSTFLIYAPVGIVAFLVTYFFDYTLIGRYSKLIYSILFAMTILDFFILDKVNGAYPHVYHATLLFIPVFGGIIYGFRNSGYLGIIACGIFYFGVALICIISPRITGLVIFTISSLIILTIAIMKGYFRCNKKVGLAIVYVPTIIGALLSMSLLFLSSPYRRARLSLLFNPELDPSGAGWQHLMVKRLFSASQPFGEAVLDGSFSNMPINQLLPGWETDFSLTFIIAKLGYVTGFSIVAIILILIIRIFISVIKQKNAFGFLISLAACISMTSQFILYVLSNIGLIAPFPSTLPFISFGGMGFVVNMILLGIVLSVYRRSNLVFDKLQSIPYNKRLFTFENGKLIIDLGINASKEDN